MNMTIFFSHLRIHAKEIGTSQRIHTKKSQSISATKKAKENRKKVEFFFQHSEAEVGGGK